MVARVMKPIAFALLDKDTRARAILHLERDDALLEQLGKYGIGKEAVPAEMGGCCQHRHQGWLDIRRTVESKK